MNEPKQDTNRLGVDCIALFDSEPLTTPEPWMPEARQMAGQCWCDDETKDTEMDVILAEAVAKRIALWMDSAAQAERNTAYYRSLLVRCGKAIGDRAYTQDDGGRVDEVLLAKIPEIIEADYVNGGG